jgi:hypothetical protein
LHIIPIYNFDVLRSTAKAMGEHRSNWESKTPLDSDYANDARILDKNVSKMNEILDVCRFRV